MHSTARRALLDHERHLGDGDDLQVRLEGSVDDPSRCRAILDAWLPGCANRDLVLLIASELVTNAVLHGTGRRFLRASAIDGAVRLGVLDESPELPVQQNPTQSATSGRGLLLVDRTAAGWGVGKESSHKEVWALISPGRASASR